MSQRSADPDMRLWRAFLAANDAVTARVGAFKTSMLQDVEAGRPIELDALLGAPREIARRMGIQTPALDRLYGVTHLMGESLD